MDLVDNIEENERGDGYEEGSDLLGKLYIDAMEQLSRELEAFFDSEPQALEILSNKLSKIPEKYDEEMRKNIREALDVKALKHPEKWKELLDRGLTPDRLQDAGITISSTLICNYRAHNLCKKSKLFLDSGGAWDSNKKLLDSRDLLIFQIVCCSCVTKSIAEILFDWYIEIAKNYPYIFRNFIVNPQDSGLLLSPIWPPPRDMPPDEDTDNSNSFYESHSKNRWLKKI